MCFHATCVGGHQSGSPRGSARPPLVRGLMIACVVLHPTLCPWLAEKGFPREVTLHGHGDAELRVLVATLMWCTHLPPFLPSEDPSEGGSAAAPPPRSRLCLCPQAHPPSWKLGTSGTEVALEHLRDARASPAPAGHGLGWGSPLVVDVLSGPTVRAQPHAGWSRGIMLHPHGPFWELGTHPQVPICQGLHTPLQSQQDPA